MSNAADDIRQLGWAWASVLVLITAITNGLVAAFWTGVELLDAGVAALDTSDIKLVWTFVLQTYPVSLAVALSIGACVIFDNEMHKFAAIAGILMLGILLSIWAGHATLPEISACQLKGGGPAAWLTSSLQCYFQIYAWQKLLGAVAIGCVSVLTLVKAGPHVSDWLVDR